MTLRVAILAHGFIPQYRVRLYELLNRRADAEYVVFHGKAPSDLGTHAAQGPFAFPARHVRNREIRIGRWTAIYQPVVGAVMTGGYDAVVLGHEVRFLSGTLLAPLCKLRRIAVLFWGFGYHYDVEIGANPGDQPRRWGTSSILASKDRLTRMADGYLTYTSQGIEKLAEIGFPRERVHVLQNTIDVTRQLALHEGLLNVDPTEIRRELGLRPDSVLFLFIGRLIELKRVEELIEGVRRIIAENRVSRPIETVIVGAGPDEERLKAAARDVPGIRFVGELPLDEQAARYLKVAAALVIPGNVGLAVVHGFAHGRPMITRQHPLHGPEVNYIASGENGLIVDGDMEAFTETLARFADSPKWQQRLAAGALRTRDDFRIETMAERFHEAVRSTVARRRGHNGDAAARAPGVKSVKEPRHRPKF
jgi:glycosyltransferase involved in cell wall biosynthesis